MSLGISKPLQEEAITIRGNNINNMNENDDGKSDLESIGVDNAKLPFYKRKSHWVFHMISILKSSKTNILLVFFIPAVVMESRNADEIIKFFFNFLAIIPLSNMLNIGINDLSARIGPVYCAVFHAFSGNFVELVIESFALVDENYAIVRSVVLGSILCNITLVLGIIFIVGSWPTKRRRHENSSFSLNASFEIKLLVNTSASILALAVLALVTPAAFKLAITSSDTSISSYVECNIQNISHATAIILAFIYAGLLVFQLKTHSKEMVDVEEFDTTVKYNLFLDLFLIAASIAGITVCARFLVSSIEHVAIKLELGAGFIGIVLLPLCVVSNFMEHYEAIHNAAHDRLDTAVSIILNTSVQMALLMAPILVLVGWILRKPLTLDFNALEIAVLSCAVLIVNYLVADNKANWLEGYMLIASYLLIAVAFFYFPNISEPPRSFYCDPFSRNLPPKNATDSPGLGEHR